METLVGALAACNNVVHCAKPSSFYSGLKSCQKKVFLK